MLRFDAGVFVFPLILRALRLISAAIVLFLLKLQALTCRVWRKVRPLASQPSRSAPCNQLTPPSRSISPAGT